MTKAVNLVDVIGTIIFNFAYLLWDSPAVQIMYAVNID